MRDFKGMKRQRGRNRNGGGKPQHNSNRAFDSNGPDGIKVRGAAQHVYEKYQQLARDAHTAGDRVTAENYLQHAEHYFRVMRAMQPQRPVADILGRDQFVSGYDIDFEDESGAAAAAAAAEAEAESVEERGAERPPERNGERPFDRNGQDRPYNDRRDRWQDRGERQGGERYERFDRDRDRDRGERWQDRGDRPPRQWRDERPRFNRDDRNRDDRSRDDRDRWPRESEAPPAAAPAEPQGQPGEMLRADDGGMAHAPAFLQARPPEPREAAGDGEPRRPRRRRGPRSEPVSEGDEES